MIRLHSQRIPLRAPDGSVELFALDQLRALLARLFAQVGMTEEWAADHIASVIEDYLRYHHENAGAGSEMRQEELHSLAVRTLLDAGFSDVAALYRDTIGIEGALEPLSALPWDTDRVSTLVRQDLGLGIEYAEAVAETVEEKLQTLGFPSVSDDLICQVAAHILHSGRDGFPATPARSVDEPSAAAANHGPTDTPPCPEEAELLEDGTLRFTPVTTVVPVSRAELHLGKIAHDCGDPLIFFEFLLVPRVDRAVRAACRALGRIREGILADCPRAAAYPARLTIAGLDELHDALLEHGSKSDASRRVTSLQDMIHDRATSTAEFPLVITYN